MHRNIALLLAGVLFAWTGVAASAPDPHQVPLNEVYYLEIVTPDPAAIAALYAETCGWSFAEAAPELGGAFVAERPDGSLCGIRAPMHDQEKPVVRPYVLVSDLTAAVAAARRQGAEIAIESMDIPGRGRIAIYLLGGIEQGLWQLP